MSPQEFVEKLMGLALPEERSAYLQAQFHLIEGRDYEQVVNGLLRQVIGLMQSNAAHSIDIAELMLEFATRTGDPRHRAVGLRAKAQAIGNGKGLYLESIPLFEEAIEIHRQNQDRYGEALVCLTYIWALAYVGRAQEAIARGERALPILQENPDKVKVAHMYNNLGLVKNRIGAYAQAFELFSQAGQRYEALGGDWLKAIPGVENNRALALFNTGDFSRAAELAKRAITLADSYEFTSTKARALHTLGLIRYFQGNYNEALQIYNQSIALHTNLSQEQEIALCKLSKTDCLLELRQFREVIKLCDELKPVFQKLNFSIERAETIRNRASALVGLRRYVPAIEALTEARQLFFQEKHWLRVAYADLQLAICYRQQKRVQESIETALQCADTFAHHGLTLDASLARLVASWGYVSEGLGAQAAALVAEVEATGQASSWARVRYQVSHLKGLLAKLKGEKQQALAQLALAAAELENLRGNAMIEHRVNFVEDKQAVYETLVQLWIEQGEVAKGLEYVELAKSRTLVELVRSRAEAELESYARENDPDMRHLQTLRGAREEKLRYTLKQVEAAASDLHVNIAEIEREIHTLEEQITEKWHQLLIRNTQGPRTTPAGDVQIQTVQAHLDPDTLLLEYFVIEDQFFVFTVPGLATNQPVQVFPLHVKPSQVSQLIQYLNLNFDLVAGGASPNGSVLQNAQGYLKRLYEWLVLPIEAVLTPYTKIIVVPYASLHAVPFHALYDSTHYLTERFAISYLPAASLWRFCKETPITTQGCLTIGHSFHGKLPYAVEEARHVAALWGETAFCEEQARIRDLQSLLSEVRLIHIACHGDYHDENTLFSGLMLGDGSFTTLDVFGLRLRASLVTLSACQTGRSKIGGGDELLGLMRAFLSVGTISLLMTLWPVSDESTIFWMKKFNTLLKMGKTKAEAVQLAQIEFLSGTVYGSKYQHPFFWGPFLLIGDNGIL
ncbi:MAG: CHAT domain-containing protein [Anaerolineales bacterium]|nr:CHAT domain-containing protein [Anaerolineales bacterium]